SGADELLERRFLADGVEVGVALRVVAHAVHQLDRLAKVLERLVRPAGEALAAGEVVERYGVSRHGPGDLRRAVGDRGVLARLVERPERRPDLPAADLVRLPGDTADRDDRRSRLLGERGSL